MLLVRRFISRGKLRSRPRGPTFRSVSLATRAAASCATETCERARRAFGWAGLIDARRDEPWARPDARKAFLPRIARGFAALLPADDIGLLSDDLHNAFRERRGPKLRGERCFATLLCSFEYLVPTAFVAFTRV